MTFWASSRRQGILFRLYHDGVLLGPRAHERLEPCANFSGGMIMLQHECKRAVSVPAMRITVVVVGWWLAQLSHVADPGVAQAQPAKAKAAKPNEDSLGYTAQFEREL